jgi:3-oxoacyl-[acyl-carrier-protein] synthase-3
MKMTREADPRSVGIVAVGTYLPEAVETSREMSEKSGFPETVFVDRIGVRQKPVAAPDEHPGEMGVRAALDALRRAGVDPAEIDLVLFGGCAFYDYGVWSPAAHIQNAIGASSAFAYEIKNGCNGGNLGLHLASRHLLGDPDLESALVVCSDVFSRLVDYRDERILSLFPGGDGATAALLRKGHDGNRILAYAGITDGSLVDAVRVPTGGTRQPDEGRGSHWQIDDPEQLAAVFSSLYVKNYVRVVSEALRKSGHTIDDIDFLFTNQVKKSTAESILAALDLSPDKTCRTMERYGHLASSDTLLGLAQTLDAGRIHPGDLVVLASSGMGFHWAATVVQY